MDLMTIILLIVLIMKLLAIFNAIRWLNRNGVSYGQHLAQHPPKSQADYYLAFEECNGKFFPFGIKDFRLRRYIEQGKGNKVLTYGSCFFQEYLFRFNRLIVVIILYLFIMGGLIPLDQVTVFISENFHSFGLYLLAVIALGSNFFLSIEAIYSYAILESYAGLFHMQTVKEGRSLLSDLGIFVWRVLTTVGAGATAFYIAYIKYDALSGHIILRGQDGLWNRLKIYLQCVYFTTTTFATVGYGDIIPQNGKGQLIAFLVEIQSFSLVAIVIAIVIASLLASRNR